MCNPRRVNVTATRELAEAWQREVAASVTVSGEVQGHAEVRQSLAESLGAPAARALQQLLTRPDGVEGWHEEGGAYRFDVEGGFVRYNPAERELEIVATRQASIEVEGRGSRTVEGVTRGTATGSGEGRFWDDGYGGRNETVGQQEAQQNADQDMERDAQRQISEDQQRAADAIGEDVRADAQADGQRRFAELSTERREELNREARARLNAVGVRGRQAFHQLLAQAYRDVLLAYARQQGGEVVTCDDRGDVLEIELRLPT